MSSFQTPIYPPKCEKALQLLLYHIQISPRSPDIQAQMRSAWYVLHALLPEPSSNPNDLFQPEGD
jgi:hypothetical protein